MNKIEDLLVNKGLYDFVEICGYDGRELTPFLLGGSKATIDCFCVDCAERRIFQLESGVRMEAASGFGVLTFSGASSGTGYPATAGARRVASSYTSNFDSCLNNIYILTFVCAKNEKHSIHFLLKTTDSEIAKIGQYPSFADISVGAKNKYKPVLENRYYVEYSKALGLFSHGVGIGSFVYLRRIIENLVLDRFNEAAGQLAISEEDFIKYRFDEKIKLLKDFLPQILIDNSNVYGIISKGIHELGEEECLKMFPLLLIGIESILDDLIAKKEKQTKEKQFASFVAKTTGDLRA